MSTETNKATVRRMIEQVWNKRRTDLIDEFYTQDVVEHIVGYPSSSGLQAVKEGTAILLNPYPDQRITIEEEIAEGDKVVQRWTSRGTHQGELLGIPPTGKQITTTGVTIYRLVNARIAEVWFFPDNLGTLQQLGVVPAMGAA